MCVRLCSALCSFVGVIGRGMLSPVGAEVAPNCRQGPLAGSVAVASVVWVAVVGGYDQSFHSLDGGEAFDLESRTWQPLPPMAHGRDSPGMVAVAGGLLAVGAQQDGAPNELFDEASGRWFELPHPMAQPRFSCTAVSLPAAALAPPAGAAAAAAAQWPTAAGEAAAQ